jgi:hypothetical protein
VLKEDSERVLRKYTNVTAFRRHVRSQKRWLHAIVSELDAGTITDRHNLCVEMTRDKRILPSCDG